MERRPSFPDSLLRNEIAVWIATELAGVNKFTVSTRYWDALGKVPEAELRERWDAARSMLHLALDGRAVFSSRQAAAEAKALRLLVEGYY